MSPARLGILVSGGGRTALNIARRCRRPGAAVLHAGDLDAGDLDAGVAIVIAHREDTPAVARCRAAGLRVAVIPIAGEAGVACVEDRVDSALEAAQVDIVCLAGYLRKFRVGERWAGRTLNIHPGLLPDFGGHGMYGDRVHAAVLAAGARESGCTVHEVDGEYDRGPVVLERRCAVETGDSVESLAARVFELECEAYPEAIARFLARLRGPRPDRGMECAR
jgi:folate-dependent phosphoribosylglycinamide formyltransferase PurN